MEVIFHIVNKRQGGSKGWDLPYGEAHNVICQQLTRNDQAMSWARAAELATSMLVKADRHAGAPIVRYSVEVTAQ
jgi:hypothetical protein